MLERERFDLLHFHEPFVPFLSLDRCCATRRSVNIATFHAYGGFSPVVRVRPAGACGGYAAPAPRPDRGQRGRAPLHRPLLPGRLQGHPERRRRRPLPAGRARSRAGRTARANILFVGRFEPRKGLLDLLKAYRILRKTGCDCRLLVVGAGPQEREARRYVATRRLPRRRVPRPRQRRREGPAASGPPTSTCSPATGRRVVRDRPARGDGRRARRSSRSRHPRLQGRRPARRAGACSCRRATRRRSPPRSARLLGDDELRGARWARPAAIRAEEFSWERVTAKVDDYYGFVIRRLAGPGRAAAGLPRPDPGLAAAAARHDGGVADRGDGRRIRRDAPRSGHGRPGLGAPPGGLSACE